MRVVRDCDGAHRGCEKDIDFHLLHLVLHPFLELNLPRLNYKFPPEPGEGYPVVRNHDDHKADQRLFPRIVGKRRNIVVLAQESFRRSELANFSPKTRAFVNEHKCIEPKLAAPAGHVTEMSWFGILYGIYAYHHHSFGINHILSYPLKVRTLIEI